MKVLKIVSIIFVLAWSGSVVAQSGRFRDLWNRLFPRRFIYEQDAPVVYRVVNDPTQVRRMTVTRDNLFGWLNLKNYIRFHLWSRQNPDLAHELLVGDEDALNKSSFDPGRLTKIFVHGYQDNANEVSIGDWQVFGKNAYLELADVNVIAVDYSFFAAAPFYFNPIHELVGEKLKDLLQFLMKYGLDLNSVHLIGWSWGAHASGLAGQALNGKIGRITGLDPAGPLFKFVDEEFRLDKSDAQFVDVIHTNGGTRLFWGGHFGHPDNLGHVDVYPNGGERQTGCPMEHTFNVGSLLCNHGRGNRYFVESILNPLAFPMCPCEDYDQFVRNECPCSLQDAAFMGEHLSHTTRGPFFIITRAHHPYGHGPQVKFSTSVHKRREPIDKRPPTETSLHTSRNDVSRNKTAETSENVQGIRNKTTSLVSSDLASVEYKNSSLKIKFINRYNSKIHSSYPNDDILKMSLAVYRKLEGKVDK